MPFLAVNGVTVDVEYGSFKERSVHSGDLFARTLSGRVAEARGQRTRAWTFRTTPMSQSDAEATRDWLEGSGQSWSFDSAAHSYSGAGVTATVAGTYTRSNVGGKYGGKLNIGAGSQFGVDMSNKLGRRRGWTTSAWTIGMWRNFVAGETYAAGFHSLIVKGVVGNVRGVSSDYVPGSQYVDGVLDNAAHLARLMQVATSSPFVAIFGYKTDNTTAAIDYDDLWFVPFVMPVAWIPQVHAFMAAYAFSAFPRVKITGAAIPDTLPVEVVCRVDELDIVQEVDGSVQNNKRVLQVEMQEW